MHVTEFNRALTKISATGKIDMDSFSWFVSYILKLYKVLKYHLFIVPGKVYKVKQDLEWDSEGLKDFGSYSKWTNKEY